MKKILLISVFLMLTGCSDTDNSFIDLSFLWPEAPQCQPCPQCQACPDCNDSIDGYITDIADQIDVNSVKLNHYINQVKVEENFAELIGLDGHITTKNHITLPEYLGQPIKHILIIEFTQVK